MQMISAFTHSGFTVVMQSSSAAESVWIWHHMWKKSKSIRKTRSWAIPSWSLTQQIPVTHQKKMLICKLEEKNAQPFEKEITSQEKCRVFIDVSEGSDRTKGERKRARRMGIKDEPWEKKQQRNKRVYFCRWHDEEESNIDKKKVHQLFTLFACEFLFFLGYEK